MTVIHIPPELNNHTSVAIIRKKPNYFFELKNEKYPVVPFIDTLGLIGGNWTNADDKCPNDTLKREIFEELPDIKDQNISPVAFAEYLMEVPEKTYGRKHATVTSVFLIEVDSEIKSSYEGIIEKIPLGKLIKGYKRKFCWGQEKIVMDYFKSLGHDISLVGFDEISMKRLDSDPLTPYSQRDLEVYKNNPFLNTIEDNELFRD